MSLEKMKERGDKHGVRGEDCVRLFQNGLTEATAQKAEALGIPLSQIWNWFQQFGPSFLTHLTEILNLLKAPKAKPKPPEPKPEPEEQETEE